METINFILNVAILIMLFIAITLSFLNLIFKIKISRAMKRAAKTIGSEVENALNKMTAEFRERINLLSKENAKVREHNEELKERLKNMGFKHFD